MILSQTTRLWFRLPAKLLERTVRTASASRLRRWSHLLLQAEDLGFTAEAEVPRRPTDKTDVHSHRQHRARRPGFASRKAARTRNCIPCNCCIADAGDIRILQRAELVHAATTVRRSRHIVCGAGGRRELVGDGFQEKFGAAESIRAGKAQLELQQAHDQLEERVKERTAQLKFQITARKESELQFKGHPEGAHAPGAGTSRYGGADAHRHRAAIGHDLEAFPGAARRREPSSRAGPQFGVAKPGGCAAVGLGFALARAGAVRSAGRVDRPAANNSRTARISIWKCPPKAGCGRSPKRWRKICCASPRKP